VRGGVRPSSGPRLLGIEGLRAIAAASIVIYHCWSYAAPPNAAFQVGALDVVLRQLPLGVTLFFTLSGFLLYRPFAAAVIRAERLPSVSAYLRNRALRILPAYWVILLVTGLVLGAVWMRHAGTDLAIGSLRHDPQLLLTDASLMQNYSPDTLFTGIGPTWSLAIEAVYYLLLPCLALLALLIGRRVRTGTGRRLAALTAPSLLLVVGVVGKVLAAAVVRPVPVGQSSAIDWHTVLEHTFLAQADLFAFGMIVAVLRVDAEDGRLRLPRRWRPAVVCGLLLLSLPTLALTDLHLISPYVHDTVLALCCALLLALAVLEPQDGARPAVVRVLEHRFLVFTGVISYSIFLWHEPLIWWLRANGLTIGGRAGFPASLVVVAIATWACATLTYRLVERPALALRVRTERRRSESPIARTTGRKLMLGVVGASGALRPVVGPDLPTCPRRRDQRDGGNQHGDRRRTWLHVGPTCDHGDGERNNGGVAKQEQAVVLDRTATEAAAADLVAPLLQAGADNRHREDEHQHDRAHGTQAGLPEEGRRDGELHPREDKEPDDPQRARQVVAQQLPAPGVVANDLRRRCPGQGQGQG
jgi:peptidoglycan/LPS O-acetylase OafA/YrhL